MNKTNKGVEKHQNTFGPNFFEHLAEESWTYIKTVVDVLREPVVILDKNFCVLVANAPFYQTFQVAPEETEHKHVYELGNGQWAIPALRKLLEDILPKNTFFKGFEVDHVFPNIGRKIMILNARQIYFKDPEDTEKFSSIILLAIEDVTEMMVVAETLSDYADQLEGKLAERTRKLEVHIVKLEKEINGLKKSAKK